MKKAIFTKAMAIAIIAGGIFTGCMSQAQKDEAARAKVENPRTNLNNSDVEVRTVSEKTATAEEWRVFKNESDTKMKENDVRIAELKVELNKPGNTLDPLYVKRIEKLEEQNKGMRNRITVYEKNQSDWGTFKREFNKDMDALGKDLKDVFTDKNS